MDVELVNDFFGKLSPLEKDEVYIILGGARKKYARSEDDISASHEIVTRQMVRKYDFHLFKQAVRKTKALLRVSTDKNTKFDFPDHVHVIYVSINPRSTFEAMNRTSVKFHQYYRSLALVDNPAAKEEAFNQVKRFNVHYFSELQKSSSRKDLGIVDVDVKNESLLQDCIQAVTLEYVHFVTETHGGYHVIYNRRANEYLLGREKRLDKIRKVYGLNKEDLDTFKDRLTPIWGTEQGGFVVRPYLDWFE